jgi:pimeloyl-ACP methyl ester carboxylesterase
MRQFGIVKTGHRRKTGRPRKHRPVGTLLRRLIGVLLILTSVAMALSREPDRSVESLVARWAPQPSQFIDLGGQLVHLRDEGPRNDPEPLVLIHGTSASLHTWDGWTQALRKQRRVIRFDLPGFGLTGPWTGPREGRSYHGDELARFALDLLDHLQVTRAVVAGNSLGGEVAWRMAVLAPTRVGRLVLVDALGPDFQPEEVPAGFLLASVPVLNRIAEFALPRSMVAQGVRSVYGDPSRVSDALVDRYFELTLREGNRRALGQRMSAMVRGEGAEAIAQVKVPTLILWGEKDRLIPPAVAIEFERLITGSQRVVLPGLGHVPQEEDPQASLAPVRTFLGLQ